MRRNCEERNLGLSATPLLALMDRERAEDPVDPRVRKRMHGVWAVFETIAQFFGRALDVNGNHLRVPPVAENAFVHPGKMRLIDEVLDGACGAALPRKRPD